MVGVAKTSLAISILSACGVVATGAFTIKATVKATHRIDAEMMRRDSEGLDTHLSFSDKAKLCWKDFIIPVALGSVTIAGIVGSQYINMKAQATLMGALTSGKLLYDKYGKKVKEYIGEDKLKELKKEFVLDGAKDIPEKEEKLDEKKLRKAKTKFPEKFLNDDDEPFMCFLDAAEDERSCQSGYFYATKNQLDCAEMILNKTMHEMHTATIADFLDALTDVGVYEAEPTNISSVLGWNLEDVISSGADDTWISLNTEVYDEGTDNGEREVLCLEFSVPPITDYDLGRNNGIIYNISRGIPFSGVPGNEHIY